jgi:hypothetical protein
MVVVVATSRRSVGDTRRIVGTLANMPTDPAVDLNVVLSGQRDRGIGSRERFRYRG